MPAFSTDHDRGVPFLHKTFAELLLGALEHFLLDGTAIPVLRIQRRCQFCRARRIIGKQKLERVLRGPQPAGRVEPRAKRESEIAAGERRLKGTDLEQSSE